MAGVEHDQLGPDGGVGLASDFFLATAAGGLRPGARRAQAKGRQASQRGKQIAAVKSGHGNASLVRGSYSLF